MCVILLKLVTRYLDVNRIEKNTARLRDLFQKASTIYKLRGILGVTSFKDVYDSLLDIQKQRMNEIVGPRLAGYLQSGNIISFAYVYPDGVIDNIGVTHDGIYDKKAWNVYAEWYTYLNNSLDLSSKIIAEEFNGVAISATTTGMASKINHVSQYFPNVVSHRVHAENAGIGWRGKNGLIVNPRHSCMIRLSGVITDEPLIHTTGSVEDCGNCYSCEEACPFLRHRDKLDDYREQCRVYLDKLGLDEEVCGKCIKACVHSPRMVKSRREPVEQGFETVYYTFI